jgi:hypothetical protein
VLSWPDCGASLILHRVPGSAGVMDTIILGTDGRVLALRERRDGPSTDHLWTDDTMERGPKGAPKCAAFAAVGGVTYRRSGGGARSRPVCPSPSIRVYRNGWTTIYGPESLNRFTASDAKITP